MKMNQKQMKVRDMTLTAVMAALICVAGPLVVPIGPIPLSLASFAVYLAGAVLGSRRGTLAVALYLLIGLIGIPVFSGFSGGFQKLAGVTGGYLVGYLPCAFLSGLGGERAEERHRRWILPLMMVLGTAVLYLIGTAWFMFVYARQSGAIGLGTALAWCVIPYLIPDAIKIALATFLTKRLYPLLKKGSTA